MSRVLTVSILVGLLAFTPACVSAQGRKGKGKANKMALDSTPADYVALAKYRGIQGKIVSIDPAGGVVTVQVEINVPVVKQAKGGNRNNINRNPNNINRNRNRNNFNRNRNRNRNNFNRNRNRNNFNRNRNNGRNNNLQAQRQRLLQLQRQMQQAALRQRQQYLRQIQQLQRQMQQQAQNVNYKTYTKELTLPISSKVQVARKVLPQEYDEKGFIKQYTDAELAKMKHPKLPGYKAEIMDVMPGQGVVLYFGKVKPRPKFKKEQNEKKPENKAPKGDDKNALEAILGQPGKAKQPEGQEPNAGGILGQRPNGPPVVGIVVVSLAEESPMRGKRKRKKKN